MREANRIAHEKELSEYLSDIGGRMHNEDLEGDIERCWRALRQACLKAGTNKVPVADVMEELKLILEQTYGSVPEGYQDEAKVSSFIAGLFLTHRGIASICQDIVPEGIIYLEDIRPNNNFAEIIELIKSEQEQESVRIQEQVTGSQRHTDNLLVRAKKAKQKEEKSLKKAIELSQTEEAVEIVLGPEQVQHITTQEGAFEADQSNPEIVEESLGSHEWLVE